MLHKRFKSAKCKTALKLATSRIKLMKNKKGVQINQMKKELAQLLETGQERTARIRVEHVIREEKMVAAYDLIEIYCELIVARLPIIESQKTCPIDLKEAVTSVIFAAPRCSDISELYDVRKQFTAKYGKDFVSAAIELHPDCGVSRMLVEKLSAVAPDLQTKIKVLSAVAKDHNIDWDPTSFEEKESKPSSDLLNGPASFENASMANVEPPKIQPVHSHEEKQSAPVDFSEQNRKYTLNTQNITSIDSGVETSSSGVTHDWMETKQNWNMEFKDATSAAQAAAESAERAAVAARAAAQFSSQEKIANRPPTGPHVFNSRDEYPHVSTSSGYNGESFLDDGKPNMSNQDIGQSQHATSQKANERFNRSNNDSAGPHVSNSRYEPSHVSAPSGYSGESSSDDRKPKTSNQDIYQSQHGTSQKATETFDRSNNDLTEDETLVNNFHMTDGYYENSVHEDQEGSSSPERESKTELVSDRKESIENENINFFATEKQPTIHSSQSHFSSYSDEPDVRKKAVVGNPFAVVDQESPFKESVKTSPNVDDDVISDDDDVGGGPRFDTGFEYGEMEANIWSPKTNTIDKPNSQSHIFSESVSFGDQSMKSIEPSETDNFAPASFDHSDGPDSGSESELLSMNPKSSSVTESSQTFNSRKTRIELNDLVEEGTSFEDEEKQMQSQHELKKRNLDQKSSDSSDDNDNGDSINQRLNFGTLTGGLRNKGGLKYPPYTKSATIEKSTAGSQTFFQSSLDSRASRIEDKKPKVPISISDSDSDSDLKANKTVSTRPIFSPPAAFFNDDGMDSEDEAPKQVTNKVRLGSGLSRRTRGSPSVPYSKTNVETGQIKSTTSEPQVNRFAHTKQEAVKIMPESKNPMGERISSRIVVESGNLKDAKTQNVGSEMTSEVKKASHVHPKLPEYDSLAARLQSLRTDRQ
ncbi:putative vacuolar protein sorting-associated protein Ist1 [Helianthus debilis subsp. tardiflorus]